MKIYDPYLGKLNDRICSSKTIHVSGCIHPTEVNKFQSEIGSILSFSLALESLPIRPNSTLNVLDFDDTIYARANQLQMPILQDNRGPSGNYIIRNVLGHQSVLEQFYQHEEVVRRLLGVINSRSPLHDAVILTAGEKDWQIKKCKSVGIREEIIPIEVVEKANQKPRKLLEHIIALGYIPGKIIIYEDRPEYFLDSGLYLSKLLHGTEIVVDKVTLSQGGTRQIGKIEQTIFLPDRDIIIK